VLNAILLHGTIYFDSLLMQSIFMNMVKNSKILEALNHYKDDFEAHILSRGNSISENSMESIQSNRDRTMFTTIVYGTYAYEVSLRVKKSSMRVKGSCSCPYNGECKHLAAMIKVLIESLKDDSSARTATNQSQAISLKALPTTRSHVIKATSLNEILDNIDAISTVRRNNSYNPEYLQVLFAKGEVRSEIYVHDWTPQGAQYLKVHTSAIKFTKDSVTITCPDCNFNKNKICKHAKASLNNLLCIITEIDPSYYDYNNQIENFAKKFGLTSQYLQENAELILKWNTIEIKITDPDVINPLDLEKLELIILESNAIKQNQLLASIEESVQYGEGFCWSSVTGIESQKMLFVIKGKLNKTRNKLASQISCQEQPTLLAPEAKALYKAVSAHNFDREYIDYNEHLNVTSTLNLIKQNLPQLQSCINYYYNPKSNQSYNYYREGKLYKKDLRCITFSNKLFKLSFDASEQENHYTLKVLTYADELRLDLSLANKVDFNYHFVLIDDVAYVYDNPLSYHFLQALDFKTPLKFLPSDKEKFVRLLSKLEQSFEVVKDKHLSNICVRVQKLKKLIQLKEVGQHVLFYPFLTKSKRRFNVLEPNIVLNKKAELVVPDEHEVAEYKQEFLELFSEEFYPEPEISFIHMGVSEYINAGWYLEFLSKCEILGIQLEGLDQFKNIKFSKFKAEIKEDITSKIDWFELKVTLSFGDEIVPRKKWIKALKEGKSYIELSDGTLGIIPEEWRRRMDEVLALAEVSGTNFNVNKLRFNALDNLFANVSDKKLLNEISAQKKLLSSYKELDKKKEIPRSIKAILRPYQEASFQWMHFLQSSGFGGILADDMGLGKTLQIICMLASAKETGKCHALVILPRSLIFNWSKEIKKFCPALTTHVHHGTQRHLASKEMKAANVVISTYGTVVNDIEVIRKTTFTHIVLDESQAIKNPTSKRYKSIRLLKGKFKICATGTPVQNNTFDLYAQVSFTNPGLLGNQSYFKQNFATPIDKNQNVEAAKLLQKMIHPFILRRTKEQVASDLPEKVESTIYCEMFSHQRKMYNELKEQIRRDLLSISEDDSKLKFKVLDGLLRLRQLCNSPRLVDNKLKGEKAQSTKIESLVQKLTEGIGNGNALVFSQFVQMLSLIREELDKRGIPYAYLDGTTRNREAVVEEYMENPKYRIFLISLKAGNTGLNLTKAQYVFLVDPWWNPAAEAQAIDRAHRIGQTKNIFAYKMICKDTVEEKILQLQSKKKKIASQLIKVDESSFKNMNKKDLMALFD